MINYKGFSIIELKPPYKIERNGDLKKFLIKKEGWGTETTRSLYIAKALIDEITFIDNVIVPAINRNVKM